MNKHHLLLGLSLIGLLWLSACRDKELDTTVINKSLFETVEFTGIEAEDSWNVIVVQDDHRTGVELEYSAFLEDYLMVVNKDKQLVVGFSQRLNLPSYTVNTVTVYVKNIEQIKLDENASMTLQGTFTGPKLTMELDHLATLRGGCFQGDIDMDLDEGSTVVDFTVQGTTCVLELKKASVFKGTLTATNKLSITVQEDSRVTTYGGECQKADIQLKDVGFLNTVQTPIAEMNLQVRDASEASVNVTSRLEGLVHQNSKVFYLGNPDINMDIDNTSSIYPL